MNQVKYICRYVAILVCLAVLLVFSVNAADVKIIGASISPASHVTSYSNGSVAMDYRQPLSWCINNPVPSYRGTTIEPQPHYDFYVWYSQQPLYRISGTPGTTIAMTLAGSDYSGYVMVNGNLMRVTDAPVSRTEFNTFFDFDAYANWHAQITPNWTYSGSYDITWDYYDIYTQTRKEFSAPYMYLTGPDFQRIELSYYSRMSVTSSEIHSSGHHSVGTCGACGVSWGNKWDDTTYDQLYHFVRPSNTGELPVNICAQIDNTGHAYTIENNPVTSSILQYANSHLGYAVTRNIKVFNNLGYTSGSISSSTSSSTLALSRNWTIESGSFTGAPAITGNPVIKKGTLIDTSGASQFIVDYDSEIKSQTVSGSQTTTVINLSNPPIIIDWDDFPGIELPEMDFAAPVITVTREPSSMVDAVESVTLTITAEDPNGHDDPLPISINGGAYQASPATYKATENQVVSVIAKDTFGNVREYNINITNIDAEAPVITNIEQNTEKWTKDKVKVTVTAQDDVKLHKTAAYKYSFKPNDSTKQAVETDWQASRFYTVEDAGKLTVWVRDSVGKISEPETFEIRNIDKIAPTATYTISPEPPAKANKDDGVLVSLTLIDTADSVTQESSGLAAAAVKWDTNSPWEEATEKVFHENGIYRVKIKDAVGNVSAEIPVEITNISTAAPVIDSFTRDKTDNGYVTSPVTLTVKAHASESSLHDRPYSWDGGATWTSVNSLKVYENKEYGVIVRDAAGNKTEEYISVLNIDSVKPTASIYMVKGAPNEDPTAEPEDWVWKIRVEADDIGSGVQAIDTLWDSQSYTSSPVVIEIVEAGIYGVTVTDKAGNQTYAEKIVTDESIGGAGGSGNGEYVEVKVPEGGSAGAPFNAAIGDLVYGKTGAYNVKTDTFTSYTSGQEGLTVNVVVGSRSGRYIKGSVNFNNMDYTLTFNGASDTSARGKSSVPAQAFIPISGITNDINNGRIRITVQEYSDSAMTKHVRDGVAQLYTSVQITEPTLMYTYDSVADKLTLSATSTVAGIKSVTVNTGSGAVEYTEPIGLGSVSSVTMTATDNVGGTVSITKTAEDLELNGGGGGSLPVDAGDGSVNSQYQSSRAYESYIIGGSKSNTENLPSSSVFNELLEGAA